MLRLLISTGEVSGDLQGSLLVKAIFQEAKRRSLDVEVIALGGPRIKEAGAKLIVDTAHMGAIGLWEALPFVLPTYFAQSKLNNFLLKRPLDVVILIDYMGPNIRLGNKLRREHPKVPIVYYIAPQEWAWSFGDGGTTDLIKFSNKILAIFQAEAEFYTSRGGDVTWVGHPMVDLLRPLPLREEALKKLNLKNDWKVLLLFPASRTQELRYLMPTLLKAAALIQRHDPSVYVVVPAALKSFERSISKALDNEGIIGTVIPSDEVDEMKPFLFSAAALAIGKSGTINMELALNDVPQIVGYRVSRITAFLARRILGFKVDHISPVNLLMNKRLVPELVQDEFNHTSLFDLSISLINDSRSREKMLQGYQQLRRNMGSSGVTNRAAKEILDLVQL